METRDRSFWSKIVSPSLRDILMPQIGITSHVSGPFVESVPLEDCGDFVWALACISRWAPEALLARYRTIQLPHSATREALLFSAIEAGDFYDFPAKSLKKLLVRLQSNVDCAPPGSPMEEAHDIALDRIQDLIVFLAENHPAARGWIEAYQPPAATVAQVKASQRPAKKKRPSHLKLVSG